jgi:hypothetical protein
MNKIRLVLALFAFSVGTYAHAQWNDDSGDANGSLCRVGEYCPPDGDMDGGGVPPDPWDTPPIDNHGGGNHGGGHGGHNGPVNPPGGFGNHKEVYVGQYFRDQQIDLMWTLGLQYEQGRRIESVQIFVRTGDSANVALIADYYTEDQQSAYGSWITLRPLRNLVIGQTFNRLMLQVMGKLYIERIGVDLAPSYEPNPPPYPPNGGEVVVPGYVGQTFYGQGNVDILRTANLYNYQGYRIREVTVYGRALGYLARARILGNGMIVGQLSFGTAISPQTARISQPFVIGQNLNALNMLVDDQAQIDRIEVRLSRY